MAEIPPDVQERISRNWDTLPPDVQDRLTRAGIGAGEASVTSAAPATPASGTAIASWSARPLFQAGGAALGGTAGLLAGAPTVFGAPTAGVVGAGLGGAAGGQLYDIIKQLQAGNIVGSPEKVPQEAAQVGEDILSGAKSEMMGQSVGKAVGSTISPLLRRREARRAAVAARRAMFERQGVTPSASDLRKSRALGQVEQVPHVAAFGSGPVQRFREKQLESAGTRAKQVLMPRGEGPGPVATGLRGQKAISEAKERFQQQTGPVFDELEQLAGETPLVPTTEIKSTIARLTARRARTPLGVSSATKRILPEPKLNLPPELDAVLTEAQKTEQIPFWLAREIESQLGEYARLSKGQMIGNLRHGEFGALYAAIRKDLDGFLKTGVGEEIAPRLAELKQQYRVGIDLFNESMGPLVEKSNPEELVKNIFRPDAITEILDFKQAVPEEVYTRHVNEWGRQLYASATDKAGRLLPSSLAREIAKYDKGGTLDVILPPEAADQVREMAKAFAEMGTAERMASTGPGTAQALFNSIGLGTLAGLVPLTQGNYPAAAGAFMTTVGVPAALGQLTTRQGGINALANPPSILELLNPNIIRAIGHAITSGPVERLGGRVLRQPQQ